MNRAQPSGRIAAVVLTLAGVAAVTSHTPVWAPARRGVGDVSELVTIVVVGFSASFAVAAAAVLWLRRTREVSWQRILPSVVVAAALISLAGISRMDLHLEAPPPGVERTDPEGGRRGIRLIMGWGTAVRRPAEESAEEDLQPASSSRELFVRLLLLLAGVSAVALLLRARRAAREPDPASGPDSGDARARAAARGAILTTIDAMLADPDPRTAIIGAYARLLQELERTGASRRAYEGPTEHLHRVLTVLEVRPKPLRTLIHLFEVARFSEHSLTHAHRQEALSALRALATFLAVPRASAQSLKVGT